MTEKDIARSVLPIPERHYAGLIPYDAKDPDSKFPPIESVRPPAGAPNVLLIMLDDVGFGASSTFGGPCQTPTFDRLAASGLKYNRFHTTALCSPTRMALLTGRNHHSAGMGCITELATSAPGYTSVRPLDTAPLAQTLQLNGYSTAQFGKCHEVPVWETSPIGPFRQWPSDSGFEYFYGFLGGDTNQYYPALVENRKPVEPYKTPEQGYHLTEDIADKAQSWIRHQKALSPDRPFFIYFAPGATHAPHHVPKEWADKYKGKFDQGWDKLREETFARQKALGVIPPDAELTVRHHQIPAWDAMPAEAKALLARQMEVYAGFLEHTDHQVGRLISVLEELEILDDTLVFVIIGDNGASAEGTIMGTPNEIVILNGLVELEKIAFSSQNPEKLGSPAYYNHYAVGWSHAMCAPYQWTKQVASHFGGTRNGMVVHWPKGIKAHNEIRSQFFHIIDIAPTILEAARLPEPTFVNGIQQKPIQGVSIAYTFDDSKAPEGRETQYFEMFCNRGIYHKGWTAVTRHSTPFTMEPMPPFDDDVWELYDTSKDWTQAHDLSKEMPEKLHELQRLFLIEAVKYNVLPLDDRRVERFNSELSGRPSLVKGKSQIFYGGIERLNENVVLNIKNKSHSVTAEVVIPPGGGNGVLVSQGGYFGGWSLYMKDGVPKYCYNFVAVKIFDVQADKPIPAGEHQVRMEFAYDGGGLGKGGTVTLFVDGASVGSGRVEATMPMTIALDEGLDIGVENGTMVSGEYTGKTSRFDGTLKWVQIDLGLDDHDHLISPEERFRIAMIKQ